MTAIIGVQIRPASRLDVPAIVALLADDPIGQRREMPERMAPYLAAFEALAADQATQCLVATAVDGAVIGYVQITITRHLSYRGARRALIEDLRVTAAHRRHGLGTQLMEAAVAAARASDCDIVQLFAHQERDTARHFYLKHGFTDHHRGLRRKI